MRLFKRTYTFLFGQLGRKLRSDVDDFVLAVLPYQELLKIPVYEGKVHNWKHEANHIELEDEGHQQSRTPLVQSQFFVDELMIF